jgi:8-oxo-dGTP pyrophosphatase MutT (NUDIX family)
MGSYHRTVKPIHCTNCGEPNHHFRSCTEPIFSYGIIAFRSKNPVWDQTELLGADALEVLMIQRRDSIGFIELIRAKYKLTEVDYIKEQISGTTLAERKALLTKPFEELWIGLWGETTFETKQYKQEYDQAKAKFEELLNGIRINDKLVPLQELIESIPELWTTPEWGFPKGRRNILEKDLVCAIREFTEETGVQEEQVTVLKNILPIRETFIGNNSIKYCHVYYLAWIPSNVPVVFDTSNQSMIKEIGDIQWFSHGDALAHIRTTNTSKKEILQVAFTIISSTYILMDSLASHGKEKEGEHQNRRLYGQFGESYFKQSGSRRAKKSESNYTRRSTFTTVEN